ncbi:hypothetical protein, partial [Rhizobium ruizarguesonis]|uniref:hypothetical protein n=1 Tax=Rhizobium ruizarguesonis TaxID=2081791 RepID=UPI001A7E93B3
RGGDARFAAAEAGDAAAPFQFFENFLHAISLAAAGGNPAVRLCARACCRKVSAVFGQHHAPIIWRRAR